MFIAIPLQNKPSWRSPPWMTALLILINCVVYFGWQAPEEATVERAARAYAQTPLPAIEAPAYLRDLRARAEASGKNSADQYADMIERMVERKRWQVVYERIWSDWDFRQRLLAGQVIKPDSEGYADWRAARDDFTPTEARPFTPRWAMSFDFGAPPRYVTWLSNMFLHGGVEHLLGNMVFLFLFGFTLEVALGRWLYLACYLAGGIGASALAAWAYAGMGGLALGASGAISALMGMYVVLYGLRRIPFFYWVLFYFNIARWPAIVVLPVWMLTELWQHLSGGDHTAHMAHLGGFIAGALVMAALKRVRQFDLGADAAQAGQAATGAGGEDVAELERLKAKAERQTRELEFAGAARAWQQAAQLAPRDAGIAEAWFDCARHEPASEGFHAAARQVFKLPARDAATQQLQHRCYLTYLATAKPSIRLSPATLQALVRSFTAQEQWQDANNLARALLRQNPPPPGGVQAVQRLASALARAGRKEEARAWLPHLQRHAPDDEETRWLAKAVG